MNTETRYFRAYVRREGAIGQFETKDFVVTVTIQGAYSRLIEEAIASIRKQGYETYHIISHSVKRECL